MGSLDLPTSLRPLDRGVRRSGDVAQWLEELATDSLGALGDAILHAATLREALHCLADHGHACSSAPRLSFEKLPDDGRIFVLLETDSAHAAQPQALEHALARVQQVIGAISGGQARPLEVWFSHEAAAPLAGYRAQFKAPVRFGQAMTGLFLDARDLDLPLPQRNAQRHAAAIRFIDQRHPRLPRRMSTRVRIIVTHLLAEGSCTHDRVAAALGLHPRTLQRRLRDEGESFEAIKDLVRREVALRHLGQSNVSLVKMTEILGYSETSVLTRSCQRWFSASPRQLRQRRSLETAPCAQGAR